MQPLLLLLPVFYALFLWWFTTGLIMATYGRSPRTVQRSFAGATLLMLAALGGIIATRQSSSISAVYLAVTCGTILWGWHMASYYLGFITGPHPWVLPVSNGRKRDLLGLGQRFQRALRASLYHELLVLGFVLLLAALTWAQANSWGLWSFVTLWLMHISAKLNIFLGVRNFRMEFLPAHLHRLEDLLTKRPINPFFPVSVVGATAAGLFMLQQALGAETAPGQATGLLLVGVMILLGVFEHWLLVLPLPATLWGWGVRSLPQSDVTEVEARRRQNPAMRALPEHGIEG
jgi:putative photosynthetic complex assembly protein 2